MDPVQRRLWRAVESLAGRPGRVTCWHAGSGSGDDGHYHFTPTLVACLAGAVRVEGGGGRIDLAPGEVLLVDAGVRHRHAPLRAGAAAFGQGFMATWSDVLLATAGWSWHGQLAAQPSRRLIDAAMAADGDGARRAAVAALVREVLAETVQELRLGHPAVQRMLAVLWRRVHLGITAADLVQASGLGRAQAWAVFRAAYGVTPRQAIVQGRLSLAERHLAAGVGVAETARRCGFSSADVFARAWRRTHGAPPRRAARR